MTKRTDELREELYDVDGRFWKDIYAIAEKYMSKVVKPYCEKNKLDFTSGMGSWCFLVTDETSNSYRENHCMSSGMYTDQVMHDTLPVELKEILTMTIPNYGYDLATQMGDYKHIRKVKNE